MPLCIPDIIRRVHTRNGAGPGSRGTAARRAPRRPRTPPRRAAATATPPPDRARRAPCASSTWALVPRACTRSSRAQCPGGALSRRRRMQPPPRTRAPTWRATAGARTSRSGRRPRALCLRAPCACEDAPPTHPRRDHTRTHTRRRARAPLPPPPRMGAPGFYLRMPRRRLPEDGTFDATMCNPPFFADASEV